MKKIYNVLSLGGGVQSSCLALMAKHGEITPMPDFAIFADTGAEPKEVYDWLKWLERKLPFPIYKVSGGNLTEEILKPYKRKKDESKYLKNLLPIFGLNKRGQVKAALGRQCTAEFKIKPIIKKVKELCGIKRGQKEISVIQWIGISKDEMQRMKLSRDKWVENRWPLIEERMTRQDCMKWFK